MFSNFSVFVVGLYPMYHSLCEFRKLFLNQVGTRVCHFQFTLARVCLFGKVSWLHFLILYSSLIYLESGFLHRCQDLCGRWRSRVVYLWSVVCQRIVLCCQPVCGSRHHWLNDYNQVAGLVELNRLLLPPHEDNYQVDNDPPSVFAKYMSWFRVLCLNTCLRKTPIGSYHFGRLRQNFFPWYRIIGSRHRSNSVFCNAGCKSTAPYKCNRSGFLTSGTSNSYVKSIVRLEMTIRCSLVSFGYHINYAPVV